MDQARQKSSSSYTPADLDTEFLQREELRSVRIGLELLKPMEISVPHMGSTYDV